MILCHKCGGVLKGVIAGLYGCECISGHIRGFGPDLSREEAIKTQIRHTELRIGYYERQAREPHWIESENVRLQKLQSLKPV